ncbi:MAG TPA: L,D-transpeptidase [Flavisolibacter sp.]|nr:L,D-transpeptidase [Flavisolibacter sp.]
MLKKISCLAALAFILHTGCSEGPVKPARQSPEPAPAPERIRLVISIADRQLSVLRGRDTLRSYPVAVGQAEYPTPRGEFKIHQIDWNPDWTPPESDWTENKEYTPPADPENPMGKARIIYQMPYTIHGTKDLESLGGAESHGSIRMANRDVVELARLIMEESGSGKPAEWYSQVLADSAKMVSVKLRDSIPLTNK